MILAYALILRLGMSVKDVEWTMAMTDWSEEDCKRVGRSLATNMRMVQTGEAMIDMWRSQYTQLNTIFSEVVGFNEFMVVIANNLLLDNKFGVLYRISVGAALGTIDAATDIYVIYTYLQSEELVGQAFALLGMICTNTILQICVILGQYQNKSWGAKLREALITLSFLHPAADAYRVSTNHEDVEATINSLDEMMYNKSIELATESIPGCMLQIYVFLKRPEQAGTYALLSIAISAMTTGFNSAMIAYNGDVDVSHRHSQPDFFGYIPNEYNSR